LAKRNSLASVAGTEIKAIDTHEPKNICHCNSGGLESFRVKELARKAYQAAIYTEKYESAAFREEINMI
jgi:hypothetical protein